MAMVFKAKTSYLNLQTKYENLVGGRSLLESSLHKHLIEHLNAEVRVLKCVKKVA